MESNYSNRDFERYVQQNADQYRMFPSEKVWKGVHNALHTRRRWYGLGLAFLLLLTGGAVTLVMRTYPVSKKQDAAAVNTNLPFTSTPEVTVLPATPEDMRELLPFDQQPGQVQKDPAGTVPSPAISLVTEAVVIPFFNTATDDIAEEQQAVVIDMSARERTTALNKHTLSAPPAESIESVTSEKTAAISLPVKTAAVQAKRDNQLAALPYTIESVTNFYKAPKPKLSWQVFFTPTVSYRRLMENKSFSGSPGNVIYPFATMEDVNNAVTHKPDLGLQLGVMARYPLSKSLKLRAGIQFNINRYDIKAALSYATEPAVINLDDGTNNTITAWTQYRNQSGYRSDWLKNFYFSVSLPVGAELQLFGNQKTSVGIAGTIQPTYVITDRAYLISTDYKNYAKVPWLIRHVNMSTGFEAFVNYTKGKTKWQVGPQVRYQLLSSFQNKYPVKENLFDFGVKVGVTLNNK